MLQRLGSPKLLAVVVRREVALRGGHDDLNNFLLATRNPEEYILSMDIRRLNKFRQDLLSLTESSERMAEISDPVCIPEL